MKENVDTNRRLSVSDFGNPMFDRQAFRLHTAANRWHEGKREELIEGTTFTDNFNHIAVTYSLKDSSITILNTSNEILYKGFIYSSEDYEKALKKVDQKQRRLDSKRQ